MFFPYLHAIFFAIFLWNGQSVFWSSYIHVSAYLYHSLTNDAARQQFMPIVLHINLWSNHYFIPFPGSIFQITTGINERFHTHRTRQNAVHGRRGHVGALYKLKTLLSVLSPSNEYNHWHQQAPHTRRSRIRSTAWRKLDAPQEGLESHVINVILRRWYGIWITPQEKKEKWRSTAIHQRRTTPKNRCVLNGQKSWWMYVFVRAKTMQVGGDGYLRFTMINPRRFHNHS